MKTELKFKVGDRVRVKSLEWYDFNKDVRGDICDNTWYVFVREMVRYCGKVLTIIKLKGDFYVVEENIFCWQDWMLEDEAVTEQTKPKFDPNSLQPFDKVLVRQDEISKWTARLFDYYNGKFCTTSNDSWSYGIPYNDDTKHLHRTCDEAPEFYRLD